jgi:hypothetical protein
MLYGYSGAVFGGRNWLFGPATAGLVGAQNASFEMMAPYLAGLTNATPDEESVMRKIMDDYAAEAEAWYRMNSARIEASAPDLCRRIDEAVARNKDKRGIWD